MAAGNHEEEVGVEESVKDSELPQHRLRSHLQHVLQGAAELRVADDDVPGAGKVKDGQHQFRPVDAVAAVAELQLGEGAPQELVVLVVVARLQQLIALIVPVECLE